MRGAGRRVVSPSCWGRSTAEIGTPAGFLLILGEYPDETRIFGEAITATGHTQVAGVLATYDFSGFGVIGDIGGGRAT